MCGVPEVPHKVCIGFLFTQKVFSLSKFYFQLYYNTFYLNTRIFDISQNIMHLQFVIIFLVDF
jgi:hypothetical protein